jgi:hypothetical protein
LGLRRFTRPTNGFSKKVEKLEHAVSLHFMHYNFHRTNVHSCHEDALRASVTLSDERAALGRELPVILMTEDIDSRLAEPPKPVSANSGR